MATWLISVPFASPYAPAIISRLATSDAQADDQIERDHCQRPVHHEGTENPQRGVLGRLLPDDETENATSSAAKLSRVVHGRQPSLLRRAWRLLRASGVHALKIRRCGHNCGDFMLLIRRWLAS